MIHELTLVRELRPGTPEPDRLTVLRARRTLLHKATEGRRRRRRRVIAAGVGVAATLVVLVVAPPWGGGSAPAAATALTFAHLAEHPDVRPDEFLHIKKTERLWGYGGTAEVDPWALEYWVPGDGSSSWIERSGEPGDQETRHFDDWGPNLYVDHADDTDGLLAQLRAYATSHGEDDDLHGLWTVAFWIVLDPVAPESFKTEVMAALSSLAGVTAADPNFSSPGLNGRALAMTKGAPTDVWFVVDPTSGSFLGLVGHPAKDETWVGPEDPMWTIVIENEVTDSAPHCVSFYPLCW